MSSGAVPVIVNRSGGAAARMGAELEPALRKAFTDHGLTIALQLCAGEEMRGALAAVAGAPLVIIGGGDGTLGQAAGVLAEAGSTMGILPLGTRNHLARQMGIPGDIDAAAAVIAASKAVCIDLARCGERVFVNNASIGIYTRLVRTREAIGGPKWLGTMPAVMNMLRHWRSQRLTLKFAGKSRRLSTPLLFIGNNRYLLEAGKVGQRESLCGGTLSLYAVSAQTPLRMFGFALRAIAGRADPERDFVELAEAAAVTVGGHRRVVIDIAFDGEVEETGLPLQFEIWPRALKVIAGILPVSA